MDPVRLSSILPQSQMVECENATMPVLAHDSPTWDGLRDPIARDIANFLDGRTHGESLLHALYDYVLDESIPERLRELLEK
jgi:hypothetical protein